MALALTAPARDLFVRLLSYSADEMTDGGLTRAIATMLAAADLEHGTEALEELIAKGELAIEAHESFRLVRWRDFNLSRDEIETKRAQTAEAGHRGGRSRIAKATRDPATGRVLAQGPYEAPGERPDDRVGARQDSQTTIQTGDQIRPPDPVSRPPASDDRYPTTEDVADTADLTVSPTPIPDGKHSIIALGPIAERRDAPPGQGEATRDFAADTGRLDVAALCSAKRTAALTPAQRRVLDEIAGRHDVEGPAWAADVIASTPTDADPMDFLLAADREWKAVQLAEAEDTEQTWLAEKEAERKSAASATDWARVALSDPHADPTRRATAEAWLRVGERLSTVGHARRSPRAGLA